MTQQQIVHKRHQWCALTAGSHIPAAEVGHHGDAGTLGNDGRVAQLQGGGHTLAGIGRNVPHRLAVAADEIHLRRGEICRLDGLQRRLGEPFAKGEVQLAQLVHRAGFGTEGGKNLLPQLCRHGQGHKAQQLPVQSGRCARKAHAGGINAVGAGAAHQADADHLQVSSLSMADSNSSTMPLRTFAIERFSRPG